MKRVGFLVVVIGLAGLSAICQAGSVGTTTVPVEGILGLSPVGPTTYVAVFIPVLEAQALAGIKWYNNDALAPFPVLLLASGASAAPAAVTEAEVVAQVVEGISSGWSELVFDEPFCSAGEGSGTGAGIGYGTGGGLTGWLSADGQQWVGLRAGFGLAVQPILVGADLSMRVMSRAEAAPEPPPAPLQTALLPSGPNPFNPRTEIRFTLAAAQLVSLSVYNARGALVRRLADEVYDAGEHAIVWDGRNERGQGLASGMYIARFQAGNMVTTRRLTLVR
jgi:hypothetical protein